MLNTQAVNTPKGRNAKAVGIDNMLCGGYCPLATHSNTYAVYSRAVVIIVIVIAIAIAFFIILYAHIPKLHLLIVLRLFIARLLCRDSLRSYSQVTLAHTYK